jgi:hypothetical protein
MENNEYIIPPQWRRRVPICITVTYLECSEEDREALDIEILRILWFL